MRHYLSCISFEKNTKTDYLLDRCELVRPDLESSNYDWNKGCLLGHFFVSNTSFGNNEVIFITEENNDCLKSVLFDHM